MEPEPELRRDRALPSERQRLELLTWRLVAAEVERAGCALVMEAHAGGGQYDEIRLYAQDPAKDAPWISINRPGSVHVHQGSQLHSRPMLQAMQRGLRTADAAGWLAKRFGDQSRATTPPALINSARFMSVVMDRLAAIAPTVEWQWRMAFLDSSGGCGGPDEEWLHSLPRELLDHHPQARAAYLQHRGATVWVLTRDGEQSIAINPYAALAWIGNELRPIAALDASAVGRTIFAADEGPDDPDLHVGARRQTFRAVADRLAHHVGIEGLRPFKPGKALSARAVWYESADQTTLAVVTGRHESPAVALESFAFALAWQQDRDLVVVVPEEHAGQIIELTPWLDVPIRVFEYGVDLVPRPVVLPPEAEVWAEVRARPVRPLVPHDLGDLADHVSSLVDFAEQHPALERHHRPSYLSWRIDGKIVLKIARKTGGLRVVAGLGATYPQPGFEPCELLVDGPLADSERQTLVTAVKQAVQARLDHDGSYPEHRLQARLMAHGLPDLGIKRSRLVREYPAYRSAGQPGYLDLLGLDDRNRLHVVEVKVGQDTALPLQALQYAIWVRVHGAEIRRERGWPAAGPGGERVLIDFILGRGSGNGRAIGPYAAGVLEAITRSVDWWVWVVDDLAAEMPVLASSGSRRLPEPDGTVVSKPVRGPRWSGRVRAALAPDGRLMRVPSEAFSAPALAVYHDLKDRGLLHRYSLHVSSSQAFAINLFAPLTDDGVRALLGRCGLDVVEVEPIAYEWTDPTEGLREARPGSPHTTQVDVLLRGRTAGGERVGVLVEVKLTETDFSHCSAYGAAGNPVRDNCRWLGRFGEDVDRCFQLTNRGTGRRLYDRFVEPGLEHGNGLNGPVIGCTLRLGANQPMRLRALAGSLVERGELARAVVAVCAPVGHDVIWRRFHEAEPVLRSGGGEPPLHRVDAELVADLHRDGGAAIRARYWDLLTA